jgi:rubredoxin
MPDTKYKCRSCGYVYDPETGDLMTGIPPGTPFEELPENWICPLCGVRKTEFFEIND